MTLHEQIEAAAGRKITVLYEDQLLALYPGPKAEARRLLDRWSRVVPIPDLITGKVSCSGPLVLVIREHRGGWLVQLVEGLKKS